MSKVGIQGIPRLIHTHPVESYFMKSLIRFMSARVYSSNNYDACGYSMYCKCRAYYNSILFKGLTS